MSFLETKGLTRRFGGLTAVDGVDFRLESGEIRAVIGPNGAGKTTLVSMICGRVAPSDGAILFGGADITHLPPWERVARGIVYTFQITSVFRNLSCFENVALAAQRALTLGKAPWHAVDQATLSTSVANALERVELHERHETPAANLPYGHQRLLEVAMSLALKPKLLVLDEPTQGLSEAEITNFCKLVREIVADATILLIEHNMDVVMSLSHEIVVMSNGSVIACGSPEAIRRNESVRSIYLGEDAQ